MNPHSFAPFKVSHRTATRRGDIFYGGDKIKVWINTLDYTLIVPELVMIEFRDFLSTNNYKCKLILRLAGRIGRLACRRSLGAFL